MARIAGVDLPSNQLETLVKNVKLAELFRNKGINFSRRGIFSFLLLNSIK